MGKLLFVAVMLVGCTQHNPRDCTDGACTDIAYPFCDVDGTIAGNGSPHTCIAVSCTANELQACRGDEAIVCNATGTNYDVTACQKGCDVSQGGCVGCIDDTSCMNPTPHCDTSSRECRGCESDDECASTVCDHDTGTCLDAASMIYASPTGADAGVCGTQATACSFVRAFALLDVSHTRVRLLPGTYSPVLSAYLVNGGQTATVYGAGATVNLSGQIAVTSGGHLEVRDLTVNNLGTSTLFYCNTPVATFSRLDLIGCTLEAGIGGVLSSGGCDGTIARSVLHGTSTALVRLSGGGSPLRPSNYVIDRVSFDGATAITADSASTALVTNSIIQNGTDGIHGGVIGYLGTSIDISFSTFVNSPIIDCFNVNPGVAKTMKFSNDIMFATSGTSVSNDGTTCTFSYMLMTPQATALTNSSHVTVSVPPKFKDQANGDFHLLLGSPAIDTADPTATLDHDFDGVTRPQGGQRDMGAFEYKP